MNDTPITESEIRDLRLWLAEQDVGKTNLRALTIRAFLSGLEYGVTKASFEQVRQQVNRMAS